MTWQDEAQTVRNVAEAIERVLREAPQGGRIATLRSALARCGVSDKHFDHAVEVLVIQRRVRKSRGRLTKE